MFLIRYKDALSDELVDAMLGWVEGNAKRHTDAVLEAIFEIFPHPYHA